MNAETIKPWPWWRVTITILSVLGVTLSAYLSWHHLMGGTVIGCGGGSGCDQVLSSRWSSVAGVVPVSGLAAGTYLAMLVAILFMSPGSAAADRRLAWGALLVLGGATAGSAVWFTILQKWDVGAYCPYCLATHITGLLLAALVIWRAPKEFENASGAAAPENPEAPAAPRRIFGLLPAISLTVVGLALAGTLAGVQIAFVPPAVYRGGETQEFQLPKIDPRSVPLVGSPDAPYVITLMFDYKCSHCQKTHAMLDEVIRRYNGKVAFALCPAPLNTRCNPYVARDIDQFKDSCELARIGLAVWVADRKAFPAFDTWMFEGEPERLLAPRTIEAATAKAVELVGQAKFDAARVNPWIDRHMQISVETYGSTILPDQGGNAVPKLVLGTRWVTPEPNDADDLVSILHDALDLPLANPAPK